MANITINLDTSYFNAPYLPMLNNKEWFNVFWSGARSGESHFFGAENHTPSPATQQSPHSFCA